MKVTVISLPNNTVCPLAKTGLRRRLSNTAAGRACRGRPPRPALEGEVIDDQRGSTGGGTEKLLVQPPEGERHRRGQK
jgi:hypothetical protein